VRMIQVAHGRYDTRISACGLNEREGASESEWGWGPTSIKECCEGTGRGGAAPRQSNK